MVTAITRQLSKVSSPYQRCKQSLKHDDSCGDKTDYPYVPMGYSTAQVGIYGNHAYPILGRLRLRLTYTMYLEV